MCFIKGPLPVASRKFCVFFKFGSLTIWNLLIKCRSERKFFPDPHCLFQTLKLCNRIHNSCFRHSTKKNRLTDGLDSHLLIDFLRTRSGQKEKNGTIQDPHPVKWIMWICVKKMCNAIFLIFPWLAESVREKKRGVSGSRILRFFFSTGSFFQNFTAEWIVSRFF